MRYSRMESVKHNTNIQHLRQSCLLSLMLNHKNREALTKSIHSGNLIGDIAEQLEIHWNAKGKVTQVKDNSTNPPKIISFDYDAHGNRVKKTVDLGSTNCADNSVTYYIYSEKGTVVATYKRKGCFETAMPIILSDHTIQSNQRMGLRIYPQTGTIVPLDNVAHYNTQGYSSREIFRKHSDHLGNLRAVISDAKWNKAKTEKSNAKK